MNNLKQRLPILILITVLLASCSSKPGAPEPPPASLWEGQRYDGAYTIEVDQPSALRDTPLTIRVAGLQPGQPIALRAQMMMRDGQVLESSATFKADGDGGNQRLLLVVDDSMAAGFPCVCDSGPSVYFWLIKEMRDGNGDPI